MRLSLFVAGLALAACGPVSAQEHYALRSAADLARLCATPSTASDQATAVSFCHGVLAGAYGYFLSATPAADRFVCLPAEPKITRTQIANSFVSWLQARPQFANDGAIDALFRFAAEAYPCKR